MRTIILMLALVICQLSFAQGFKVKEFKQNLNDGSAFHAPMDAEGHPCGLIKVRTDNSDLKFKGSIVGDVENKMNEYWVYVPQSSQQIIVNHPNFMPFVVSFSDYGIKVSPKATYVLTIEEIKYKKEKSGVTIIVKPENADLYIDDEYVDNLSGNGYYQLYLPKGEHVCKMSKTGYRPNVQIIQTGKASQNINVELESVMAELEVKCRTATAEIFVDGELKGNGIWKGELVAGEHKVEARQQNYNSHTQTITLAEKESRAFTIPELKRSMGKIEIETIPSKVPVIVDGKDVGLSPCTIDIESGKHYVSCNTYGCVPYRSDIEVASGKMSTLKVIMEFDKENWLQEEYAKAYKGDMEAIGELASMKISWVYRGSSHNPEDDSKEAIYWLERYNHPDEFLIQDGLIETYCYAGNPDKALQLFPYIQQTIESRGGYFSSDINMEYIGNAFLKKKEYDKAISCFLKAVEYDDDGNGFGLEGLGDCYIAKGDKQRAATYYKKFLKSDYYDGKKRVERKLKEIEH